jgi:hypothetical protein
MQTEADFLALLIDLAVFDPQIQYKMAHFFNVNPPTLCDALSIGQCDASNVYRSTRSIRRTHAPSIPSRQLHANVGVTVQCANPIPRTLTCPVSCSTLSTVDCTMFDQIVSSLSLSLTPSPPVFLTEACTLKVGRGVNTPIYDNTQAWLQLSFASLLPLDTTLAEADALARAIDNLPLPSIVEKEVLRWLNSNDPTCKASVEKREVGDRPSRATHAPTPNPGDCVLTGVNVTFDAPVVCPSACDNKNNIDCSHFDKAALTLPLLTPVTTLGCRKQGDGKTLQVPVICVERGRNFL